jgi:hypothetical protein
MGSSGWAVKEWVGHYLVWAHGATATEMSRACRRHRASSRLVAELKVRNRGCASAGVTRSLNARVRVGTKHTSCQARLAGLFPDALLTII